MHSKLLLVGSLAVSLAALASAPAAKADENKGQIAVGERGGKASKTLTFCDGAAQEQVFTNTQDAPATTTSTAFVAIPSTTVPGGGSGSATDSDTYTVTFAGQADASAGSWEVKAQRSVNGGAFVDMAPIGPNTFLTGTSAQTHSMTWCNRLVASSSASFRIVWRKLGGGSATIDDYTMRVERSN